MPVWNPAMQSSHNDEKIRRRRRVKESPAEHDEYENNMSPLEQTLTPDEFSRRSFERHDGYIRRTFYPDFIGEYEESPK